MRMIPSAVCFAVEDPHQQKPDGPVCLHAEHHSPGPGLRCAHSPLDFEERESNSLHHHPPPTSPPVHHHHAHPRVTIDSAPANKTIQSPPLKHATLIQRTPSSCLSLPARLPSLGAAPRPHLPPSLLHLPAQWTPTTAALSPSAQAPSTLVPALH